MIWGWGRNRMVAKDSLDRKWQKNLMRGVKRQTVSVLSNMVCRSCDETLHSLVSVVSKHL